MPQFPNYHPTPASVWVTFPTEKQELFRSLGGFPVNDHFLPLWGRADTYALELLLLYGTYGSSKTTDRINELILCCKHDKYFKCYYGRNTFELAKKELHSSIVSGIKDMGLESEFDFSESPNGTKEITHKITKNKFKPFGCDDEESIKGWDNATHIFVDEINQIPFKVFGMLITRLRSKKGRKCFVGCFNNCDVQEDHWIRSILLNKDKPLADDAGVPLKMNIIEHFSLFTHNYFIDHDEYRQGLIIQAGGDPIRADQLINGKWGASTTGQPFYKCFNRNLNVAFTEYNPKRALHLSWDENVNPYLPLGIFQCEGKNIYMIDEIAAKNPHNTLRWVCDELIRRYGPDGLNHEAGVIIYGDATSKKDDTKMEKGKNFFTLIKEYLEIFKPKLRVSKSNPNVAMRGNFMNAIFGSNYDGLNITISPKCTNMIADLINVAEAPDGNGKDKTKVQVDGVKGVQRWGHFTDLLDYMVCQAHADSYYRFQKGGKSRKWEAIVRVARNSW